MASGFDDSFDLLGLGVTEQPAPKADPARGHPPALKCNVEVIAYPPAVPADAAGLEPATAPEGHAPGPEAGVEASPTSDTHHSEASQKRFVVRCEGRWRVRSAPSLSSKVIGTVANGTKVTAREVLREQLLDDLSLPTAVRIGAGAVDPAEQDNAGISSLWVQVVHFEAQEPMGVSEIKRDAASGGELYCLRRNALGYGLYEVGVEPLDGRLIKLPERLSSELRADAQRAAVDKSEDTSLTWKLLGAAENIGRFFKALTGADEGCASEDLKSQVRRRPEEVFEVRQREQLKRSVGTLKKATQKIISKAGPSQENVLAGMPKEVTRRFARLRASLVQSTTSGSQVVSHQVPQASEPSLTARAVTEGSVGDLERFVDLLIRLERTGGWPELSTELKQEVTNFSNKHADDLEHFARCLGKAEASRPGSMEGAAADQPLQTVNQGGTGADLLDSMLGGTSTAASPAAPPSVGTFGRTASGGLPLLPPPPPPPSGIGSGPLI